MIPFIDSINQNLNPDTDCLLTLVGNFTVPLKLEIPDSFQLLGVHLITPTRLIMSIRATEEGDFPIYLYNEDGQRNDLWGYQPSVRVFTGTKSVIRTDSVLASGHIANTVVIDSDNVIVANLSPDAIVSAEQNRIAVVNSIKQYLESAGSLSVDPQALSLVFDYDLMADKIAEIILPRVSAFVLEQLAPFTNNYEELAAQFLNIYNRLNVIDNDVESLSTFDTESLVNTISFQLLPQITDYVDATIGVISTRQSQITVEMANLTAAVNQLSDKIDNL